MYLPICLMRDDTCNRIQGQPRYLSGKIIIAKPPASHHIQGQHQDKTMHRLIADKQDEIAAICRRHRVERLEVFGSAARGTDFDPLRSDADFLVGYPRPLQSGFLDRWLQLNEELQGVLGCKVDLLLSDSIRNPYLKMAIDEDREVVFED